MIKLEKWMTCASRPSPSTGQSISGSSRLIQSEFTGKKQ